MQQVLFWIPIRNSRFPEGIPIYAYGAMLFVTFIVCVWFMSRRAQQQGMTVPREKIQDMAIVLFVAGLAGTAPPTCGSSEFPGTNSCVSGKAASYCKAASSAGRWRSFSFTDLFCAVSTLHFGRWPMSPLRRWRWASPSAGSVVCSTAAAGACRRRKTVQRLAFPC